MAVMEPVYYLQINEEQAIDLASGYCPPSVIASARFLLHTLDGEQAKAAARQEADAERAERRQRHARSSNRTSRRVRT
jgi:hypothetical protein